MPLAAEEKEEYRLLSMSSSGLSCFRFLFVVERCMEEASVRAARWIVEWIVEQTSWSQTGWSREFM
jgi:hypothetical protein